ncbi:MAG TPA: GNAT family N-acetyltransferase [Phycisphaerae bacterium]|nr:GNAT family N-acetyltransferase [Phycisphaerae bacterium]
MIRTMRRSDERLVAALHMKAISGGFMAQLGQRFLAQLYRGIGQDENSVVWVSEIDGVFNGFCAYTSNVAGLYKRILRRRFLQLGCAALPQALRPSIIMECLDTLRYPGKLSAIDLPAAEILSIAVEDSAQGTGTGKRLIGYALDRAQEDGETHIKVLAGHKLEGANRFYKACGFQKQLELIQHGEPLNVFVFDLQGREPIKQGYGA